MQLVLALPFRKNLETSNNLTSNVFVSSNVFPYNFRDVQTIVSTRRIHGIIHDCKNRNHETR